MRKFIKTSRGMTLIELIVAIALIGIISVVLITVYTSSIYLTVQSGDRTKNVSVVSSIVENNLEGTLVQNSLTEVGSIEIVGSGGEIKTIPNATYSEDNTVELKVLFKGSNINKRGLYNVKKITISSEKKTMKNSFIETEIEVYEP